MKTVINVTEIEPRRKHAVIFEAFDSAAENDVVTILNDHDPKPLYYQLLGERGNTFNWSYIVDGPEVWEVDIRKRPEAAETLGSIAASDMRKAEVFKRFGLDFCCGGKATLEEACAKKGLDPDDVREELEAATAAKQEDTNDYSSWSLTLLSKYIVDVHHSYVRKNLPFIQELTEHVAKRHGKTNPALIEINYRFASVVQELSAHMIKEERILFPFIEQMERGDFKLPGFNSLQQPVGMMELDHEVVGETMEQIRVLANGYVIPEDACQSQRLMFVKLEEFENDLKKHIHLENNILFPKAMKLERSLNPAL